MKMDLKIGVLGGGQLGKMLSEAALPWHLDIHILDRSPDFPAGPYAPNFVTGDFSDFDDVMRFGRDMDVITIEIESVNTDALKKLRDQGVKVFPQPEIIELIQDKGVQKTFYKDHSIPTSPFVLRSAEDISQLKKDGNIELPVVQKQRKGGYDGRGVQVVRSFDEIIEGEDSLFESLVDIEKEISVIVARNENGELAYFDVVEMVFNPLGNLVDYLISPAEITHKQAEKAIDLAGLVITELDMIGLLAVEMFLTKDGDILVNEVAPRPHNSGHHTIKNCDCSQYEMLLRTLINAPLIPGRSLMPAMMINILGAPDGTSKPVYNGLDEILNVPGIHMFLYGKKESRPFRKMGHFTITAKDRNGLLKKADIVRNKFSVSCE